MANLLAGAAQTYTVPLTIRPSGQPCSIAVFLTADQGGVNVRAQSAAVPFSSTGAQQLIPVPITMPAAGAYYVWVPVYINGVMVGVWPQGSISVASALAVIVAGQIFYNDDWYGLTYNGGSFLQSGLSSSTRLQFGFGNGSSSIIMATDSTLKVVNPDGSVQNPKIGPYSTATSVSPGNSGVAEFEPVYTPQKGNYAATLTIFQGGVAIAAATYVFTVT